MDLAALDIARAGVGKRLTRRAASMRRTASLSLIPRRRWQKSKSDEQAERRSSRRASTSMRCTRRRPRRRRVSKHTAERLERSSSSDRFASVMCCFYTRDFRAPPRAHAARLRRNRFTKRFVLVVLSKAVTCAARRPIAVSSVARASMTSKGRQQKSASTLQLHLQLQANTTAPGSVEFLWHEESSTPWSLAVHLCRAQVFRRVVVHLTLCGSVLGASRDATADAATESKALALQQIAMQQYLVNVSATESERRLKEA